MNTLDRLGLKPLIRLRKFTLSCLRSDGSPLSIFEKPKLQTGAEDGSGEEEDNVTTTLVLENEDKEARKGKKVALNLSEVQSSHNFPKSFVLRKC